MCMSDESKCTLKTFNMEDCLIVAQKSVLYDKREKNYQDNDVKENVWRGTANELQYDGAGISSFNSKTSLFKLPTMLKYH